ncbi:metallophosphoesterase [Saccharibacillus sp. JS10]|uniref:metallophosphoesterase family protein n=1 Tax=Saccharibacillus sp. JS10 TaxID=2950552 RepID=UPI00210C67E8|nr:metallophosphoesterase [Saccharibacillus sp. JS10]MCQ4085399.1 metallophosphoesterase [Saccharibacillus sp. JS10]
MNIPISRPTCDSLSPYIVVVSDTHMPRMAKSLPSELIEELEKADLIIHAGDWTKPDVYKLFEAYAPIESVAGNNDGDEIIEKFGYHRIIEIGSIRIGLTHGHIGRRSTPDNAASVFQNEQVDLIIFGHSHIPFLSPEADSSEAVPLFNPGSPTDKRRQSQYSFGIVTFNGGKVQCQHRYYAEKG